MNAQDAWKVAYSQLELQLDRATFDTWLRDSVFLSHEDGVFVIGVKNTYARDMLQTRLYRNVRRVLTDVVNAPVEIEFVLNRAVPTVPAVSVEDDMPLFRFLSETSEQETAVPPPPFHEAVRRPMLPELPESEINPRFTFDRFVVANSNSMAYEAARAVADAPGRNYNPFMVYGGVGLGKTHLLHAIAHVCAAKNLRTIYVSAEAFMNDMVAALRQKTMAMFREKYRSADVLLLDDVQFIGGKDGMQEEFFHTFNALHMFGKQVVLASDRHPRELHTLEDRLRSRFEGGLIIDIPPLEYEARIAILQMWAQEHCVKVPMQVLDVVAQGMRTNGVRELEGAFNSILAQMKFTHRPITVQDAETLVIRFDAPRMHSRKIAPRDIIDHVNAYFKLKPGELIGKGRAARLNQARQIAMYLCRELTDLSLPQIGELFGGRAHTTVLHGCNKVAESIEIDPLVEQQVDALRRALVGD